MLGSAADEEDVETAFSVPFGGSIDMDITEECKTAGQGCRHELPPATHAHNPDPKSQGEYVNWMPHSKPTFARDTSSHPALSHRIPCPQITSDWVTHRSTRERSAANTHDRG